jgi:hypothetical protein
MSLKSLSDRVLRRSHDDESQAELRAVAIEHEGDLLLIDPVRGPELGELYAEEIYNPTGDRLIRHEYHAFLTRVMRAAREGKPLMADISGDYPLMAALARKLVEKSAEAVIDEAKKARPFELPDSDRWVGDVAA